MTQTQDRGRLDCGKQNRGKMSYHAGMAAEDAVAASYARRGHTEAARRWHGSRGELDLVLHDGDGTGLIVVEVKQARDFASALAHITPAQLARIHGTATEYAATQPQGQLTELRLDVALVDGQGRVEIHENFWA